MRNITRTVYSFDELSEPAQDKAVEQVREKFAGPWWDSGDIDDVAAEIHLALAEELGSPGAAESGAADFDGIDGITLEAWDTDHLTVAFRGILHRDNAPNLPWAEGIEDVHLAGIGHRRTTEIDPRNYDDVEATEHEHETMINAIKDLLYVAIMAGRVEVERKTGDEAAREWCQDNENQEYEEDGTLA
jgi:hypothetical protein